MRIPTTLTCTLEADAIRCVLPVLYGEEDIPRDFPGRVGDVLTITLDLDTGRVRDWPSDQAADLYMKVDDAGSYFLLAGEEVVARIVENYVPHCIPEEWSDYFTPRIAHDGVVFYSAEHRNGGIPWVPDPEAIARAFLGEPR
jgi:hypothetical protein